MTARRRKPAKTAKQPRIHDGGRQRTSKSRTAVERARRDLNNASRTLTERASALARVADQIASVATEAERDRLAAELVADHIPRDLLELRDALAAVPPGTLTPALEVLRKFPDMALGWIQRYLEVVPSMRAGDVVQVPVDRLASFDIDGTLPTTGIVSLRILSPGWKRGGRVLARPRATLLR